MIIIEWFEVYFLNNEMVGSLEDLEKVVQICGEAKEMEGKISFDYVMKEESCFQIILKIMYPYSYWRCLEATYCAMYSTKLDLEWNIQIKPLWRWLYVWYEERN